jgi:hypothetical protein
MCQDMTIWLAVNAASGSNSEDTLRALDTAFAEGACTIARWIGFHEEGAPSIADLRNSGVDLLVVFAGDGTVNALVTRLYGWEGAVLVLPGGTMNILAHRLHGEREAAEIVACVAADRVRRVRPVVVRSRFGDALSEIIAGPGTAWVDVREALRESDVIGTLKGAAEAIGESTSGANVVCREPGCGRPEGYSAIQITPTADGLAIAGYYAETIGDYANHGIALLRRNFREGPHDDLGRYPWLRLACPEGDAMGLLIDGEPSQCDAASEEIFAMARCEVDLLATADAGLAVPLGA